MFQRDRVFLVRIELLSFEDLKRKIGLEVGVSKWFTIDQERINKFADVTEEDQSFKEADQARPRRTGHFPVVRLRLDVTARRRDIWIRPWLRLVTYQFVSVAHPKIQTNTIQYLVLS